MKNKKLLLVATAAMGVLALGTAGVGTAAWFAASTATMNATTAGQTGNIQASAGFTSTNGFTVAVEASSLTSISSVILTNDSGATYSTLSDGGADVIVTATGTKIATISPTLSITYTGSASTASEVEALWDAAVAAKTIKLTITDETNYAAGGQATTNFSNALVAYVGAGNHTAGSDYGLKFTADASTYAEANPNTANEEKTISVADVGFGNPSGSGDAKTTTKTGVVSGVSFYVGICGINGVVQDADDTYSLKIAPSVVNA